MDDKLESAVAFANYSQTLAVTRKTIKENVESKLTYGANGGIFKIDRSLLAFVDMLISRGRTTNVPLIDSNGNPVLIPNLEEFCEEIFDRYFTTTLEYYDKITALNKSRTVEKLLAL